MELTSTEIITIIEKLNDDYSTIINNLAKIGREGCEEEWAYKNRIEALETALYRICLAEEKKQQVTGK